MVWQGMQLDLKMLLIGSPDPSVWRPTFPINWSDTELSRELDNQTFQRRLAHFLITLHIPVSNGKLMLRIVKYVVLVVQYLAAILLPCGHVIS